MNCTIRRGTREDFPDLLSLIKEFSIFQQTPEKVTITYEQMIANEHLFQCFVAVNEKQEIIGFVSFFYAYYSWSGKATYLDDLYVKEDGRKQGIGKLLLEQIIKLATAEGCKKVRWQVSKWNSNSIAFYRRIGAVIDDTEINCDLQLY